jgi:hypothetical protein
MSEDGCGSSGRLRTLDRVLNTKMDMKARMKVVRRISTDTKLALGSSAAG